MSQLLFTRKLFLFLKLGISKVQPADVLICRQTPLTLTFIVLDLLLTVFLKKFFFLL